MYLQPPGTHGGGFGDLNTQASQLSTQAAGAGGAPGTAANMSVTPVVQVNEATPETWVRIVDTQVRPRLEAERDDLNAESL